MAERGSGEGAGPSALTRSELEDECRRASAEIESLKRQLQDLQDEHDAFASIVATSAELLAELEETREWDQFQREVERVCQRATSGDALVYGLSGVLCSCELLPVEPLALYLVGATSAEARAFVYGAAPEDLEDRVRASWARVVGSEGPTLEDGLVTVPLRVGAEVTGVLVLVVQPGHYSEMYWLHHLDSPAQHFAASIKRLNAEAELLEVNRERDEALAATEAKNAFLANMSHELRTPLNGIIGYTALIMDDLADEEYGEVGHFARSIKACGDSLLELINDLLDFSKIEAGQLELEIVPVDVRAMTEAVLDVVASSVAKKGLELVAHVDPSVPLTLLTDPTRLRQTLVNLLGNAVKFTSHGEVVVFVHGRRAVSPEGASGPWYELQVAVRDTGIGIPAGRIAQLFEPFTQADVSTTRRYGGTGLGLAICKHLVEMMGGRIWVESEVGVGSTFSFTIHAAAGPGDGAADSALGEPLRDRSVLFVDDCESLRLVLECLAASWGARARAASADRLHEACLAEGMLPDAVVLGGPRRRELAEQLRARHGPDELAIVVLTPLGSAPADDPPATLAHTSIPRPVKPSRLRAALAEVLKTHQDAEAPRSTGGAAAPAAPRRLLLVEDDPINREVAYLALRRLGYEPDTATDGVAAVEMVERGDYDVVLMDVRMPRMDGVEATRRIRAAKGPRAKPRVIAITANSTAAERERCIAAGMDDFISKPFTQRRLLSVLGRPE